MASLTETQKDLVRWFVQRVRDEMLDEEFVITWSMNTGAIILGFEGDLPDITGAKLDTLQNAGMLTCTPHLRTNKSGRTYESSRTCILTGAAYEAVDSDFKIVDTPVTQHIGVQINAPVNHSPIAGIVDAQDITVKQAIEQADATELAEIGAAYLDQIVDLVKSDLEVSQLIAYSAAVQDLKDALAESQSDHNNLQRLTRTVAFLDNANGAIELGAKAWKLSLLVLPYITPLIEVISRSVPQ